MGRGRQEDNEAASDESRGAAPADKPEWLGAGTWSELTEEPAEQGKGAKSEPQAAPATHETGPESTPPSVRLPPPPPPPPPRGVARTAVLAPAWPRAARRTEVLPPGASATAPSAAGLAGGTQRLPGEGGAGGTVPFDDSDADSAPEDVGPSIDLPPGSRVGQYEIIRELGKGGMGVVFLARDERLGRHVAIKLLQTRDQQTTRRFLVEARATAQCSHENIVVIHEVGEREGNPFMVLEYLRGQPLTSVIRKSAPMPPSRAVELIVSVVRALACAHEQGIVHRDLKPENIILTDAGTIKVLDFGIAKVLRDEQNGPGARSRPEGGPLDDAGQGGRTGIIGTKAYMSPEQWGVGGRIEVGTDIWATGIILFQALSGRHPMEAWGAEIRARVMDLDNPLPGLRDVASDVPPELAAVVDRCLRKRRDERFPDATALLRALEPFLPGRFSARPAQEIDSGPYAGLRSFQEEDADRFFGRSREIAAMVTRIADGPLVAAVGPSGVGKSSFIRAGVVPALKSSGETWEALIVRPGRDPLLALAGLLAPIVMTSSSVVDDLGAQSALLSRLGGEPGYLGAVLRSKARQSGNRLLLFVDQLEELYTLGADLAARRAFTASLAAAADDATSPVRVVVSIRSDFLGLVAEDAHFMNELGKGLFFLGPPGTEGLRDAIVQPAEQAGYRFESAAMIDEMIGHLESTPGALPLLQFTAAQLWEARDPVRKLLTRQSYDDLGGIAGALVSHADRVIEELPPDLRPLARWLFPHLVTKERTRAVRDVAELRGLASNADGFDRLVQQLVSARLLVVQTEQSKGASTVEIVHESLIGSWPTLRRFLDESHEETVFIDQLSAGARQWEANRRAAGLLWGGEMAEELARFRRRYRGELPEPMGSFAAAIEAQRVRGARLRRRLAAAGSTVLVVLLAAAAVALFVIRKAQTAAERNAVAAKSAEAEAQRRLRQVEDKERQRREATENEQKAVGAKKIADDAVTAKNLELEAKNVELTGALTRAEAERRQAEEARADAKRKAEEAIAAQKQAEEAREEAQRSAQRAERARAEAKKLADQEAERVKKLEAKLGSAVEEIQ